VVYGITARATIQCAAQKSEVSASRTWGLFKTLK
jgi:hypothetical protein